MIPCCILWYRIYSYVCLYCVVSIIIIRVRFMQPPCMLSVVQFTVCLLAHLPCVCLAKLWSTERLRNFRSRAWFEIYWQARNFGAYDLKSYWQNVVWARTVELCRICASTLCGTFPQVYRGTGTLLFNVGHLSERVVSTWTLLLIVRHLLEACCIVVDAGVQRGTSARRSPGVSWSVNGSGRVVSSHLIGSYRFVWSRLLNADTPSEQFIALLLIASRRSQSVSIHAGRSLVVVNIRLTARLQSLPLARCWCVCFALFSSFFPLLFRLALTVVKLIVGNFCSGHCHTNVPNVLCVWCLC